MGKTYRLYRAHHSLTVAVVLMGDFALSGQLLLLIPVSPDSSQKATRGSCITLRSLHSCSKQFKAPGNKSSSTGLSHMPDEAPHEQQQAAEGAAGDAAGSGGKQQDGTGLVGQRRQKLSCSLHTHRDHSACLCLCLSGAMLLLASSRCRALVPTLQLLPLARVKKMMKEAEDVKTVATDASWAVARATVSCGRRCLQTASCRSCCSTPPGAALTNANGAEVHTHPAFCVVSRPFPRLQEVFLQELAARAHAVMAADSSRKGLEYRDVGELWAFAELAGTSS